MIVDMSDTNTYGGYMELTDVKMLQPAEETVTAVIAERGKGMADYFETMVALRFDRYKAGKQNRIKRGLYPKRKAEYWIWLKRKELWI